MMKEKCYCEWFLKPELFGRREDSVKTTIFVLFTEIIILAPAQAAETFNENTCSDPGALKWLGNLYIHTYIHA